MQSFRHTRDVFNKAVAWIAPRAGIVPAGMERGPEVNKLAIADQLLLLSCQAPGWMRLRAGQSSVEFALLSRPGATSWTTNCQCLLLFGFHDHIMQRRPLTMLVNSDQSALGTQHSSVL